MKFWLADWISMTPYYLDLPSMRSLLLKTQEKRICGLRGNFMDWTGTHDYSFLFTSLATLKVRFAKAGFYVRGEKKCDLMRKYLFRVIDLERICSPKVTDFSHYINTICFNHNHSKRYFDPCSKKKAFYRYNVSMNQMQQIIYKTNEISKDRLPLSPNLSLNLSSTIQPIEWDQPVTRLEVIALRRTR